MGTIQLRDLRAGRLEIAVHRGFGAEFLEVFGSVPDDTAACGLSMASGQRLVVDDVAEDALLAGSEARAVLLRAGARALQATPLRRRSGELIGLLSTHHHRPRHPEERELQLLDVLARLAADYIERARAERATDEAQARLQAADRAKDAFLAMLGHELRNPLGAAAGALRVLDLAEDSPESMARARAVIDRQVQHLSRLVDDLLDVSRVTTGKVLLARQPLDLAGLVAGAMSTWRAAGRFDRHHVSAQLAAVWVDGDATRLEQVLDNLVGNALKYTPAGGNVTVRVGPDGVDAVLEVTDTGTGIAPAVIDKVFDLFVQGDGGLDRAQGGLGIGLTLVKALTALHGGAVDVRSDGAGKGSLVTVRLPAVPARPAADRSIPATTRPGPPRRILVIEDNDDAREMLRVALTLVGHTVYEAADGHAGVAAARDTEPDVALVDVGLPLLDGYEVARQIRAGANGKAIRLIAITGYGQAEDRRRAREAGFDAHLTKPVVPEQLAAALYEG